MRDDKVRRALASLEAATTKPTGAAERAKKKMLDAFDSDDQGVPGSMQEKGSLAGVSEIRLLAVSSDEPEEERRPRLWIPVAAAAALVLVVLAAQIDSRERFDPTLVVAADSTTDQFAEPRDETDEAAQAIDPFVDDDVPRMVQGRFSTTALGDAMSFVAAEPVWLIRHQTDLVELSRDPDDPLAATLVIARVDEPAGAGAPSTPMDFLASLPPGVTGQITPYVLDGTDSRFFRGRFDPAAAGLEDCAPTVVCLPLYELPLQIGLRAGVENDVVERPADDHAIVLVASMPFAEFGYSPFATAFDELVATLDFVEEEPTVSDD